MEKLRIGILNFAGHMNHGANLTAYALQQTFLQLGHEVHNMHLHCNPAIYKWDIFTRFADENIALTKRCAAGVYNMQAFNDDFDVFVVGSDQVWREAEDAIPGWQWKSKHYACYHLAFAAPGKRRISVAASFGNEVYNAPEYIKASLARELKRFAAISVREESALHIVKNVAGEDAVQLIDPVFYIEPAEWHKLCTHADTNHSRKGRISYNCFYHHEQMPKILESFLEDYDIYDLCSGDTYAWLNAIRSSDFVITDSYHVLCFCLIFGISFVCLAPDGQGETRFLSLQQLTGFSKNRIFRVKEVDDLPDRVCRIMEEPIDWETIHSNIENHREFARGWLDNALAIPVPAWTGPRYLPASIMDKRRELKSNSAAYVCHVIRRNRGIVRFLLAVSPIARTFLKQKKAFYDKLLEEFAW